ncbi:GNAT family acetyltransferase [Leptolyngbya sp. BL0902]|uniref:GNAT family N-acetyltransferase n=1 Tax=Leptolyngbya sp. BL0902 TaxID=1115757 RepID=UPI0018E72D53|nr:GNAT family N-acetyltransferase [Leptolyngbya sp. BL0902]QQE63766.1 GNAT family acetyltransferase [Leptolyngbya sp. BL0902]
MPPALRLATAADIPALASLYRETVLTHAPQHYSPAQTQAWAAFGADTPSFCRFILEATTYVAESDGFVADQPVVNADQPLMLGFGGLAIDGHITALYVRHDCLGQGVGSHLLTALLEKARQDRIPRLYAEASAFSLGLFQKFGFRHTATDRVERGGVTFDRHLVIFP